MARNRLQQAGVNQSYGDYNAPSTGYPAQTGNPYAQVPEAPYTPPQQGGGYTPGSYAVSTPGYGLNTPKGNGAGGSFWDQLSATNSILTELEQKIQAVKQAQLASLNSTDPNAVAYADQLSDDAKKLREEAKTAIKGLFKNIKGDKNAKAQADAAKTRFTRALNDHQQIEREYRQKTRDRAARQFKIVKPDASEAEIQSIVDSGDTQVFSQALLNTNRYGAARGAYREVQERHVELQKIEKTMSELAQMFSEMSMLVEQQDEAITQVEDTTRNVHEDIQRGNTELDSGIKKAIAARRKKWICFWIILIILIIVGVAIGIGIWQGVKK
ncbi:Protein transport protein SSO2 [Vanrija pseudolonga]|uniref:Protein transport protein SSO2 n=1 Tax=Vanrija pseudolonga TaxID=143232 RepID=A0AAF0Y9M1_9TREE|nr:Protein transport protein SSO2 [Vanrija pseudolonga]